MKKLLILVTVSSMLFVSNLFAAEFKFGVSAALTQIEADGSETEGGETNNGSADNLVIIPSLFVESAGDRFSLGLDYIPFKADVSSKTKKTTKTETSVSGTATTTSTSRTQKAQAELKDHTTIYVNTMLTDTYYLKLGYATVDLITKDSLDTGSKYGDASLDGFVFGVGQNKGNLRYEVTYTDYEDLELTSSVARTGVTTNNKIKADLDALAFRVSYAF